MERVKGKVAIVTGGALGIGRSTCQLMAKEGGRVVITDILDDEGKKTVSDILAMGGEAYFRHLNVSNAEDVEKSFAGIFEEFGKIDILVNNAGVSGVNKPTHEISDAEWDRVFNVNVKGVFHCTKSVLPYMMTAGKGSIINLSSIYGLIGDEHDPPYHATKGAVRLMSKTDAMLYAKYNIRVNSVHPGYIWTPLVQALGADALEGPEEFKKNMAELHPIGRMGEPEDIAYGILYLASDESGFVTGAELVIDGGFTAH